MLRAVLVLVLVLASVPAGAQDLRVHVRVEGRQQTWFDGWVPLRDAFPLVATSGRAYTLDAHTPLGALAATGLALRVSDEFDDLEPLAVQGEYAWDTAWWDYRVDWVQTNYGPQSQWLAGGAPAHALADGSELLWYVARHFETPLHVTALSPGIGPGPCAQAVEVQTLALDVNHEAGQPWPPVAWTPAALAALRGSTSPWAVAGAGLAVVEGSGDVWAEEPALPLAATHLTRSERIAMACPAR
ncbi:MAG: hypothetical protein LC624_09125 [Halobacteriales archaeon]|nr:hypothetical protein [Halobacteriales archaeon]